MYIKRAYKIKPHLRESRLMENIEVMDETIKEPLIICEGSYGVENSPTVEPWK